MPKLPIAILVIFQNEPEKAEKVLSQIYTHLKPVYELYVIDDSSDDHTPRVIESIIRKFNHDYTFFFENPSPLGRRRSIREILQIIDNNTLNNFQKTITNKMKKLLTLYDTEDTVLNLRLIFD